MLSVRRARALFSVGTDWLAPRWPSPSFLKPPRVLTTCGVRPPAGGIGEGTVGGKAGSRDPARTASPEPAISASAAWRPTVAGAATGGSIGFPFLAYDVAVGVDHARGRKPSECRR